MTNRRTEPRDSTMTDKDGVRYHREGDEMSEDIAEPRDGAFAGVPTFPAAGGAGGVVFAGTTANPAVDATTDPRRGTMVAPVPSGSQSGSVAQHADLGQVTPQDIAREHDMDASHGSSTASMTAVRVGMKVFDSNGEEIGEVSDLKQSDAQSVTTDGQEMATNDSFVGNIAEAFGAEDEPAVDEPLRTQLVRMGYIKIDAKGLFAGDRYARADAIAGVDANGVRLNMTKDALTKA